MRALVTGANGFLGSWLTRRLIADGHPVTTLVRGKTDAAHLSQLGVTRLEGDVGDERSVARAVERVDVVFHLAGIRRAATRAEFMRVNADGTRIVCAALAAARKSEGGQKRLVLAGSLAASGPSSRERPRLESDPPAPEEWYGESKVAAEEIALGYADRFEVTVARPPRILGPGDKENLVFFKLLKRGIRVALGGGPRPLTVVDVEDCVELLMLLATRKEAVGEAFFVTGPTTTFEEIEDETARLLGVTPRTLPLSPAVLRALAAMADVATRVTGKKLPLNRKLARQLLAPAWTSSAEKAERLLGFRATRSVAHSLETSARWYREQGWI